MTTSCAVKDKLVQQLNHLNDKLNSLHPAWVRSPEARDEIQSQREALYLQIKQHRKNGHNGQRCPAIQFNRA